MKDVTTIKRSLLHSIFALVLGLATSSIYLAIVAKYCITIFQAMLPDREDYFSQIAIIPIILPTIAFTVLTTTIFISFKKKYKAFSIIYLLVTMTTYILVSLFVKTEIVIGI